MMAVDGYVYMIQNDETTLDFIRFKHGMCESFDPSVEGEWRRSPAKDSIIEGKGDWVWYDDVPDEDVEFWTDKVRSIYEKAEK